MKQSKLPYAIAFAAIFSLGAVTSATAQEVKSIRGLDVGEMETQVIGNYRQMPDSAPIQRDFVQQPPLIPHKEDYELTLRFNECLDCHSWTRYKSANATKISLTHFKDRDGNEYSNVSPSRYFCLQCHVSITDAPPLVGNNFQPGKGLR